MIHESNNDDASAVLGIVGGAAVARVAREAGMRDYAPGVGWWAFTQTSAADQARFFAVARPPDPGALLRLREVPDVDDRARAELGRAARRTPALAGLLQDRRAALAGTVQRGRAARTRGRSASTSPSSPTATPRWPTAKRRSKASRRACWEPRGEPALRRASRRGRARGAARAPPRPRHRRAGPAPARRHPRPGSAPARRHAARAADRARLARLPLVPRAARRLPRPRDVRGRAGAAGGAPRRAVGTHRPHRGADGARRLLDGQRHELRDRPRRRTPAARRDPRLLRVHPDRARLGARRRRPRRPAGAIAHGRRTR